MCVEGGSWIGDGRRERDIIHRQALQKIHVFYFGGILRCYIKELAAEILLLGRLALTYGAVVAYEWGGSGLLLGRMPVGAYPQA